MKNLLIGAVLFSVAAFSYGQTSNDKLNSQLTEMRKFFLDENYEAFSNYTYPKVIEMMGGRDRMIEATRNGINKMKDDGYQIIDISYKDPSQFLEQDQELQCSLTQEITMQLPQGKIIAEYTLIAISNDNGQNWKFLDTSGQSKETMIKYFPNLNPDIVIKDKTQKMVD